MRGGSYRESNEFKKNLTYVKHVPKFLQSLVSQHPGTTVESKRADKLQHLDDIDERPDRDDEAPLVVAESEELLAEYELQIRTEKGERIAEAGSKKRARDEDNEEEPTASPPVEIDAQQSEEPDESGKHTFRKPKTTAATLSSGPPRKKARTQTPPARDAAGTRRPTSTPTKLGVKNTKLLSFDDDATGE